MSIPLPFFKPQEVNGGGVTVILGHSRSGKTTLLYDILCHTRRHIPVDLLFCDPQEAKRYIDIVPRSALCRELDLDRLRTVVEVKDDLRYSTLPPGCIVVDSRTNLRNSIFQNLFSTARDRNIHVLITMTDIIDLSSSLRNFVDRWIILDYQGEQCRTKLFQLGRFAAITTSSSFNEILDENTTNYNCLVIEGSTGHMSIYKADPRRCADREDDDSRPRKRQCLSAPVSLTRDVDLEVNGVVFTVPVRIDVTFGDARVNSDVDA